MNKKMSPEVRFEGFESEWLEYILSDISLKENEKNKDLSYSETFTNSAVKGILSQTDYFINEITNVKNIDNYFIVSPDAFVYNPRISESASVGPINRNKLNRTGVMSPLYYVFNVNKEKLNVDFLEWFFKTHRWHKFMYLNGNSGARSDRFSIKDSDLEKMKIKAPEDETEQKLIGSYLKNLDKDINFKEIEISKIQSFKQAMLQKIFPKEGEKKPDVRFKGFNGEWVESKLGNILDYEQPTKYIVNSDKYIDSQKTPVLTAGKRLLLGYTDETDGIYRANDKRGVIIFDDFTTSSHIINYDFKVKSSALKLLTVKNDDYNLYFAHELMQSMNFQPGNHERHWISIFSNLDVLITSKEEQIAIGNFFKELDNKIELEEQNLEKLKQFKKAMLQKMFV